MPATKPSPSRDLRSAPRSRARRYPLPPREPTAGASPTDTGVQGTLVHPRERASTAVPGMATRGSAGRALAPSPGRIAHRSRAAPGPHLPASPPRRPRSPARGGQPGGEEGSEQGSHGRRHHRPAAGRRPRPRGGEAAAGWASTATGRETTRAGGGTGLYNLAGRGRPASGRAHPTRPTRPRTGRAATPGAGKRHHRASGTGAVGEKKGSALSGGGQAAARETRPHGRALSARQAVAPPAPHRDRARPLWACSEHQLALSRDSCLRWHPPTAAAPLRWVAATGK